MTNQEKKPTQKFGSIKTQWNTIGGGEEVQTQKRFDVKTQKMERQTVWMPAELRTRLKIHAAKVGDDISGIINRLVENHLDREE